MRQIPIFVINLKKDHNKQNHMKVLAKKYNLEFDFIEAVYGKNLSMDEINKVYDKNRTINEIGREMSVGEIGCALSHVEIYQKMVDNNIEEALILEDDVTFDDDIVEALQSINNFPRDWECVMLCYYRMAYYKKNYCINFHDRLKVSNNFKTVRFTALMHSTAGYIINLSGATKLLNTLKEGVYKPIDHYTGDETHINLYGLYPRVVKIDSVFGAQSTITFERQQIGKKVTIQPEQTNDLNDDNLRKTLKKTGLFPLFKRINMQRQKIQIPVEQFIYFIFHLRDCMMQPKPYKKDK